MSKSGKFKPAKGLRKRVRVTAKGHFKRRRSGTSHLNSHMTGKRIRALRGSVICPACEAKRLRTMLGLRASS